MIYVRYVAPGSVCCDKYTYQLEEIVFPLCLQGTAKLLSWWEKLNFISHFDEKKTPSDSLVSLHIIQTIFMFKYIAEESIPQDFFLYP